MTEQQTNGYKPTPPNPSKKVPPKNSSWHQIKRLEIPLDIYSALRLQKQTFQHAFVCKNKTLNGNRNKNNSRNKQTKIHCDVNANCTKMYTKMQLAPADHYTN